MDYNVHVLKSLDFNPTFLSSTIVQIMSKYLPYIFRDKLAIFTKMTKYIMLKGIGCFFDKEYHGNHQPGQK